MQLLEVFAEIIGNNNLVKFYSRNPYNYAKVIHIYNSVINNHMHLCNLNVT